MIRVTIALVCLMAALTLVRAQTSVGYVSDHIDALLQARREQHAGKNTAARTILIGALAKAPESAALLDALGSVQQDLGEYLAAEGSYLHALKASAPTTGNVERLIILNNLGSLYLDTDQYAKGQWVRAELENVPSGAFEGHPAEAGLLLNVVGSLEHARNRDDSAVLYYRQALKLLRKAHGPVSADAAQVESNLGFLQLEMGQYTAAKDCFRRSIQEMESSLGTNDVALVPPLINLARCENLTRTSEQAEVLARRAVTISAKVLGQTHPVTAAAMFEQASALRKLGRKKEARELEKQANMSLRSASAASLSRYTVGFRQLAERTRNGAQPYSRAASGR